MVSKVPCYGSRLSILHRHPLLQEPVLQPLPLTSISTPLYFCFPALPRTPFSSLCARVCVRLFCVFASVRVFACVCLLVCVCVCVCVFVCVCVCACLFMSSSVYLFLSIVCICVFVYTCNFACMRVFVCVQDEEIVSAQKPKSDDAAGMSRPTCNLQLTWGSMCRNLPIPSKKAWCSARATKPP